MEENLGAAILLLVVLALWLLFGRRPARRDIARRVTADPGTLTVCAGGPMLHLAGIREAVLGDGRRTVEVWSIPGGSFPVPLDRWLVVEPAPGAASLLGSVSTYHEALRLAYAILE